MSRGQMSRGQMSRGQMSRGTPSPLWRLVRFAVRAGGNVCSGAPLRLALLASVAAALVSLSGCQKVPIMRGEIAGLEKLIKQADRNGAKRCAPRELALAAAHTRFASIELGQANMFRAEDHLIVARANAQAAYDLSPATKCSERKFDIAPPVAKAPPPKPAPPPPPPKPGDKDGDGYNDKEDKCVDRPENFNGYQDGDGCPDDPDSDGDGIVDSKDACELLAEDKDGYLDEDGCPDMDNDLDGVPDTKEAKKECINIPEDPDGYEDEDGCPEPDNDGDKVLDVDDFCPMVPGVKTGARPGCPKKPSLVVVTAKEIKITQQIHFAFAKAIIRPISFPVLNAVADVLKSNSKIKLEVQGHTDNVGRKNYNKRLSQRRADAVRRYLVEQGIDGTRLQSKGYGMERPIVPNTTKRGRALNRRVQFVRTEKK
jgi:OmpA-OmpF porin, OOP family